MRLVSAAAVALVAAPALGGDFAGTFEDLTAFVDEAGAAFDDTFCSETVCNGYTGNHQFQVMWPEGGWLWITYYPAGSVAERMGYCALLVAYATGLDAEAAGVLAGRLIGEANASGSARTDFGDIQVRAEPSGECDVRSPAALR